MAPQAVLTPAVLPPLRQAPPNDPGRAEPGPEPRRMPSTGAGLAKWGSGAAAGGGGAPGAGRRPGLTRLPRTQSQVLAHQPNLQPKLVSDCSKLIEIRGSPRPVAVGRPVLTA